MLRNVRPDSYWIYLVAAVVLFGVAFLPALIIYVAWTGYLKAREWSHNEHYTWVEFVDELWSFAGLCIIITVIYFIYAYVRIS